MRIIFLTLAIATLCQLVSALPAGPMIFVHSSPTDPVDIDLGSRPLEQRALGAGTIESTGDPEKGTEAQDQHKGQGSDTSVVEVKQDTPTSLIMYSPGSTTLSTLADTEPPATLSNGESAVFHPTPTTTLSLLTGAALSSAETDGTTRKLYSNTDVIATSDRTARVVAAASSGSSGTSAAGWTRHVPGWVLVLGLVSVVTLKLAM
ncbi:hypothetical protein IAU60_002483 [Kwoniella sp. DSM 27419]